MKKSFFTGLLALGLFCSTSLLAQIRTPQPSPAAGLSQTVGITDITLKYSRPSMKGREIFGKLLPFDKIWRTGANQATNIEFSTDAMIEGQKLAAGKYSIFSMPNATEFTVIFNKDAGASEQNYSQEKDALRIKVKPSECAVNQNFSFDFSDITDSSAVLSFAWEKTKVAMKIEVATTDLAIAGIDKVAEANAGQMNTGANYLLNKGKNLDKALGMINTAVGAKETFRNLWTKAQILAKMGNFTEALPIAKKVMDLGNADTTGGFGFMKDAVQKGITDYASKIPMPVGLPGKKK